MEIRNKIAVVTGATGGLGRQITLGLAAEGATLFLIYRHSQDKIEALLKEVRGMGCKAEALSADVTSEEGIAAIEAGVNAAFGGLDILVLNAAYNEAIPFSDLETLDAGKWNYIMNFNLTAPYLAVRRMAPLLKQGEGGRVVLVASIAGLSPSGSSIAYSVSKSALIHLGKCLSVALAPEVLVNSVSPGLMEGTRMTDRLDPRMVKDSKALALLKSAAKKEDVAQVVVTLVKTDSITGQTLAVDAGRVFH